MSWSKVLGSMVFLFLIWCAPSPTMAQSELRPLITYPFCVEEGREIMCTFYMTVVDGNGRPYPDTQITPEALLQVVGGDAFPGRVERVDNDTFTLLILDTSGSMRESLLEMKQAARNALDNPPTNAHFAVATFNEPEPGNPALTLLQPFTTDIASVQTTIETIEIRDDRNTCLFDATFEAVDRVLQQLNESQGALGSVITFTDGRDEKGINSGVPCSAHTPEQVVSLAQTAKPPVQVFTLGMGDKIDREALTLLAEGTGGLAVMGTAVDLPTMFQQIMDGLKSQWLVQIMLNLPAGTHAASLYLTQQNGAHLISDTVEIISNIPPLPVPQIQNFRYAEAEQVFQFEVQLDDPLPETAALQIEIWDGDGLQLDSFSQTVTANLVTLPITNLPDGKPCELIISLQMPGTAEQATSAHSFTCRGPVLPTATPLPQPSLSITSVQVSDEEKTICLHVNSVHDEQITTYALETTESGNRIDNINPQPWHAEPTICLPFDAGAGSYQFNLTGYDANNLPIASAEFRYKYAPPPAPGRLAAMTTALKENPLILSLILGIVFVVIGWLMLRSLRRRKVGRPFLKRNDGRFLSNADSPNLPFQHTQIYDEEEDAVPENTVLFGDKAIIGTLQIEKSLDLDRQGQTVEVGHTPFTIGRQNADLSIQDRYLSRPHAVISQENGVFYITDLKSGNGTTVNGQKLTAKQPHLLSPAVPTAMTLGMETRLIFIPRQPNYEESVTHIPGKPNEGVL